MKHRSDEDRRGIPAGHILLVAGCALWLGACGAQGDDAQSGDELAATLSNAGCATDADCTTSVSCNSGVRCERSSGICVMNAWDESCDEYVSCRHRDSLCNRGPDGATGTCTGWRGRECIYRWAPGSEPGDDEDTTAPAGGGEADDNAAMSCESTSDCLEATSCATGVTCEQGRCVMNAWDEACTEYVWCGGDDALCDQGPEGSSGTCTGWDSKECVYEWGSDSADGEGSSGSGSEPPDEESNPEPEPEPETGAGVLPCSLSVPHLVVSPAGNDGNEGTASSPLRSVAEALDRVSPGVTVFLRGGTYKELIRITTSGTPGQPITIRSYCGEAAKIDGAGLGAGTGTPALVSIANRSSIVVADLELFGLLGSGGNFPAGVWIRGSSRDVLVQNVVVHDIAAQNGGQQSGAHGIGVYGTSTTPAQNIRLVGNELYDLVLGWSEALVVNGNVDGFVVAGNSVHDVNNIAFDFIGFESDVCSSCSQADVVDSTNVNRVRNGVVSDNRAFNVSSSGNPAYGTEKSAGCFYVDGGARIVLERNVAHHCDLGVELASEWYGKSTREIVVRNNLLYWNDVTGIATGGYSSGNGSGGGSAVDCVVANNTIYDSSRNGWADSGILLQNRNVSNRYVNNIVVATPGSSVIADYGAANSGNVFDFNVLFGGASSGVSAGANTITSDPALVNPIAGDFSPSQGSPAIDKGTSSTGAALGETDLNGDARVSGRVDIGAIER